MKREYRSLAAGAAVILMLSGLAGCARAPAQPDPQATEAPSAAPAAAVQADPGPRAAGMGFIPPRPRDLEAM